MYTDVGRYFELGGGGDSNDTHENKCVSLYFTPDVLSKLSVKPKI